MPLDQNSKNSSSSLLPPTGRREMFELRITSIEDFMAFVAVIKGENLDMQKLKAFTKELNKDSSILIEAENAQKEK